MEKFLNKTVQITACLGGIDGSGYGFKGVLTAYDDEYVCLDNSIYITRKFILAIRVK